MYPEPNDAAVHLDSAAAHLNAVGESAQRIFASHDAHVRELQSRANFYFWMWLATLALLLAALGLR